MNLRNWDTIGGKPVTERGVGVGELVGAADHDYESVTVRIEAYWVTCDLTSLRNLEHDEMGWFAPASFNQIPLAPADRYLKELLK